MWYSLSYIVIYRRGKSSVFPRNINDIHEVLAEFGEEETGVFNKDKVDKAMEYEYYAYNELDYYQKIRCKDNGIMPKMYLYPKGKRAHINPFRTMGVNKKIN